jgi:hypothetical protein
MCLYLEEAEQLHSQASRSLIANRLCSCIYFCPTVSLMLPKKKLLPKKGFFAPKKFLLLRKHFFLIPFFFSGSQNFFWSPKKKFLVPKNFFLSSKISFLSPKKFCWRIFFGILIPRATSCRTRLRLVRHPPGRCDLMSQMRH